MRGRGTTPAHARVQFFFSFLERGRGRLVPAFFFFFFFLLGLGGARAMRTKKTVQSSKHRIAEHLLAVSPATPVRSSCGRVREEGVCHNIGA